MFKKIFNNIICRINLNHLSSNKKRLIVILFGPFFIILISILFYLSGGRYASTDNAYLKADKIAIAVEVPGRIASVNVKDNTYVYKGQELFTIEDEVFVLNVKQAHANLAKITNDLGSLKASFQQKIATLEASAANLKYLESEYLRLKKLMEKKFIAVSDFQAAEYKRDSAAKDYQALKYEADTVKAELDNDPSLPIEQYAQYLAGQAQLKNAQLNLKHTRICSPADGIVAQMTLKSGAYAAVGAPLFTVVRHKDLWIEANFKETDLTYVRPGQKAVVEIDTYPDKQWSATVISITPATGNEFSILPAQNSSGNWVKVVQRIMVRLEMIEENEPVSLAAGMSLTVTVDTGQSRWNRFFSSKLKSKD